MTPKPEKMNDSAAEALKQAEQAKVLEKLVSDADKYDLKKVAPAEVEKKQWHTPIEINELMQELGTTMGISPQLGFIATVLLFNKGAANEGSPTTMSVAVFDETDTVNITKNDLVYQYKKKYKVDYIRRLAESMSTIIGQYSESHNLSGDLARKINNKLAADKQPQLTRKEAAWTSSFHQNNPALATVSERMASLLAADYAERFKDKDQKQKTKLAPAKKKRNKINKDE